MVETNESRNPQPPTPAPNASNREVLIIVLSQYLQSHLGLVTAWWWIVKCHCGQLDLEVIHFIGRHQNSRLLSLLGFGSSFKERALCECMVSADTWGGGAVSEGIVWGTLLLGKQQSVHPTYFQPSAHPAFFTVASTGTVTMPWWEPC